MSTSNVDDIWASLQEQEKLNTSEYKNRLKSIKSKSNNFSLTEIIAQSSQQVNVKEIAKGKNLVKHKSKYHNKEETENRHAIEGIGKSFQTKQTVSKLNGNITN